MSHPINAMVYQRERHQCFQYKQHRFRYVPTFDHVQVGLEVVATKRETDRHSVDADRHGDASDAVTQRRTHR